MINSILNNRIVLLFVLALRKVFTLKTLLTMLVFAIIGWWVRTIISGYIGLDLDTLIGFTATVLPAGIITRLASELAITLVNGNSLKQGVDGPIVTTELFTSAGKRSPSPTASGSSSGPATHNMSSPTARQLSEQRAKFLSESANRNLAQAQGSDFARNHFRNQSRVIQEAEAAQNMPGVMERQRQYELELARTRQIRIAESARASALQLQAFTNSGGDVGFLIPDTQGIGARGYIHQGINQPYARLLAGELKNQAVAGKTFDPKLDANAKRFLAQALPYIRPEVYGPTPTAHGNSSMIIGQTIRKLEKMI